MRARWLLAATLALSGLAAALPPPLADDAGSGVDAPATPDAALLLPGPGRYLGNLTPVGDADWYALRAAREGPSCVEARVGGAALANVTLSPTPSLEKAATVPVEPLMGARLGLATMGLPRALLGLTPRGALDASAGSYALDLAVLTAGATGPGDAGTGLDAGVLPATALPVGPGCFGGALDPAALDAQDAYALGAQGGETLALSLAADAPAVLQLLSPSGLPVATLAPGDLATVRLDEAGTWLLLVEAGTPDAPDYLVGISSDPGRRPRPCRPTCDAEG